MPSAPQDDSSKAPGAASLCGSQTQGGHRPHSKDGKDLTAKHVLSLTPNTKHEGEHRR